MMICLQRDIKINNSYKYFLFTYDLCQNILLFVAVNKKI